MKSSSNIAPFVAPFAVFMLFLIGVDGPFAEQHYLLYPVKSFLVAGGIAWVWSRLPSLKPAAPLGSIAIGVLGVVLWVGLDRFIAEAPGRNPFQLYPAVEAWTLFGFRLAGIALVVPVMEELCWRGFLMRWLIKEDFQSVALGTYQPFSFWVTTACFASVHGVEWPLALVVGVIYGAWFVRTKSLGSIMLAHGTTNFLLALYCLWSGDWHFLSTVHTSGGHK